LEWNKSKMKITEVKVKLLEQSDDRLRAYCSITFDNQFAVKDIKIIEGPKGLFVAMPSRKLTDHCPKCNAKNHLRARFCNSCGTKLPDDRVPKNVDASKLHADVAHPINAEARAYIEQAILDEYKKEVERAKTRGATEERKESDEQGEKQ